MIRGRKGGFRGGRVSYPLHGLKTPQRALSGAGIGTLGGGVGGGRWGVFPSEDALLLGML
jgi:hypothetical protein